MDATSIAVTGAQGFVGRHLIDYLIENTDKRLVLISRTPITLKPEQSKRCDVVLLSNILSSNPDNLTKKLLGSCVSLVHLAGRAHVMKEDSADPRKAYFETNLELTKKVFLLATKLGIKKFLYLSSLKVMGEETAQSGGPFNESFPPNPLDDYGSSKLATEDYLLRSSNNSSSPQVIIIRPPLIYGPNVGANFLALLKLAKKNFPMPFAGIQNKRSILYVQNLCDFIKRCIEYDFKDKYGVFFLSDQESMSTSKLYEYLVINQSTQKARIFYIPKIIAEFIFSLLGRRSIYQRLWSSMEVDPTLAFKTFEWQPPFSTKEGLQKTCKWFSSTH